MPPALRLKEQGGQARAGPGHEMALAWLLSSQNTIRYP